MKAKPAAVPVRPPLPMARVFPGVFTPLECAELIAYAHSLPAQAATVGHGGGQAVHDMRRSTVRWINAASAEMMLIKAKLDRCFLKANAESYGLDARGYADLQFTEYSSANAGHYDFHRDDNPSPAPERWTPFDRVLSCVVQLSALESYEGGRLEFESGAVDGFRSQGDVIIFPSANRHCVTPVTRGCRYSLVAWSLGPRGQFGS